jgi:hypothetical protein
MHRHIETDGAYKPTDGFSAAAKLATPLSKPGLQLLPTG